MKPKYKTLILFLLTNSFFLTSFLESVTPEMLQEYALLYNKKSLVDILIKYGDSEYDPVLNRAMSEQDYFSVFILIEHGVDIDSRSGGLPYRNPSLTILETAIEWNEIALVEYFLLKNADPTNPQKFRQSYPYKQTCVTTAVYHAIMLGRIDILMLFAKYNVDLNKICFEVESTEYERGEYKQTPLQVAIEHNKIHIVEYLLSIGVEI